MSRTKSQTEEGGSAVDTTGSRVEQVTPAGKALQAVRDISSVCPYTTVGRKAVSAVKGGRQKIDNADNDTERDPQAMVKMGRTIALIGFFCPIFWFSLLSGARGTQLRLNAIHSGVVVLIGFCVMLKGKIALKRERRRR